MKKLIYCGALLAGLSLIACKNNDDDNPTPTETTTQKVQHKWDYVSTTTIWYDGHTSNVDSQNVDNGVAGDYIEFKTDGKMYIHTPQFGEEDYTLDYSIINDTKMMIDGEPYTINTLTATDFVVTYHDTIGINYRDDIIRLKR